MFQRQERDHFMRSQRSFSRVNPLLILLGGALVFFGVFFLPMVHGNGGGSATIAVSEWTVANFFFRYVFPPAAVLLALPLLLVLFVVGASVASFFRELSPGMLRWRRNAAIAGLVIQGLPGFFMSVIYSFAIPPLLGAGFYLELTGFALMIFSASLKRSPRHNLEKRPHMSLIDREVAENTPSSLTGYAGDTSLGMNGKADTPAYLITMYKGIGDAIAFGLSAIDQIIQNVPSAGGKIDVLCNHIQAEIFEHDPRVNRLFRASESLFKRPEVTNWLQGVIPDTETSELVRFFRNRNYTAVFPGMILPGFYSRLRVPVMSPNWLELGKNLLALRVQQDVPMHKIARRMVNRYFGNKSPLHALSDEIPLYLSSEQIQNAAEVVRDITKRSTVPHERARVLVVATDTTSVVTRPPIALLAASISQALRQCPELVVCILQGYTDASAALKLHEALKPEYDGRVFLMPAQPKAKLLDVAAFIDQADIFVTGDTGLMHLAATFKKVSEDDSTRYYPTNGVNIIALFGGTNPGLYGYRERTTILGSGRKEQVAFKPGIAKETYNPRGKNLFDHISPQQLTEAILSQGVDKPTPSLVGFSEKNRPGGRCHPERSEGSRAAPHGDPSLRSG